MTDDPAPRPHGWWRRSLAPLAVIAVALPALAFVVVGLPVIDDISRETVFEPVRPGDTVRAGGYSFTVTVSGEFPGKGTGAGGNKIPRGSALVAALLEVRPLDDAPPASEDDPEYCDLQLTSRAGGLDREWNQVDYPPDYGYGVGEDSTTWCELERMPIDVEAVFLTPEGAHDESTLDLTIGTKAFRFELEG